MTPILLAPWGRNGSTFVMSLLAGSPEILAPETYPYERHQLLHFLRAAEVLAGGDVPGSGRQADLMPGPWNGTLRKIDALPFKGEGVGLVSDLLVGLWDGWIRHLRSSGAIGGGKRLYAEKSTVEVAEAFARCRPLNVVFIVRDPRDLIASSKAFSEARGDSEFGWSNRTDTGALVRRFIVETTHCLDVLDRLPASARRTIIRYEQLALDTATVIEQLSGELGVCLAPESALPIPPGHRTSADAAASVGRWRHDLPETVVQMLTDCGRDLFVRLGYD